MPITDIEYCRLCFFFYLNSIRIIFLFFLKRIESNTRSFGAFIYLFIYFFQDKDSQKPVVANYQVTVAKSVQQIVKKYTLKAPKKTYYEDRFIKFNYNSEAANYLLKKRNENQLQRDEIDVFKQVRLRLYISLISRKRFRNYIYVIAWQNEIGIFESSMR